MTFSLSPREPRALAAEFHSGASKTRVLRCLDTWTLKNVVFSRVLGVMAPMGRLVTGLVHLGRQNHPKRNPKGSLLMSLVDTFSITKQHPERDRSQVAFSMFFVVFWRVRPSVRSRRRNRNTIFHVRRGL